MLFYFSLSMILMYHSYLDTLEAGIVGMPQRATQYLWLDSMGVTPIWLMCVIAEETHF